MSALSAVERLEAENELLRSAILGITTLDEGGVFNSMKEDVDLSRDHPVLVEVHTAAKGGG